MGYEIIFKDNGIIERYFDTVTTNEIVQVLCKMSGNCQFDDAKYKIVDFRNVKIFNLSHNVKVIIKTFQNDAYRWNPNLKVAIILSEEQLKNINLKDIGFNLDYKVFTDYKKVFIWIKEKIKKYYE